MLAPKADQSPKCSWLARLAAHAACAVLAVCSCGNPAKAAACTELPAQSKMWVRLTAPVSSYTAKPGMPVHGFLLESPACGEAPVFPIKIPVEGHVVSAHRVGLGLWHETATLEVEFDHLLPSDAPPVEIHGRVLQIDNAREQVKKGVIHGIRATDTPQGTITSRLRHMPSLQLYPDPFLLGYKMLFPVFPESEICLEPGTDLEIELPAATHLPADFAAAAPAPSLDALSPDLVSESDQQIVRDLVDLPERTVTRKGKEADVINLIFTGSRTDLEMAFATAGWLPGEHISKASVRHQFLAFLAKTNNATGPMSAQFLEGRPPDLMLEKTFDSYEKRDHLRVWSLPPKPDRAQLWASASVRETGAALSIRHKGFMHHVSPDLSDAQHVVVRDLLAAGCVASLGSIARPDMDHVLINATGEIFRTDGTLTVVRLKPCSSDYEGAGFTNAPHYRPSNKIYRYARKEILTVRSDIWRANILYAGYDLTRITVKAFQRSALHRADMHSFRAGNSPILTTTSAHAAGQSE
jgi:LssY C-terminus